MSASEHRSRHGGVALTYIYYSGGRQRAPSTQRGIKIPTTPFPVLRVVTNESQVFNISKFLRNFEISRYPRFMYGHIYSKSMDQPGQVANPARGHLNRENQYFPFAFAPENRVSRDGFGSPVPRQSTHLHTQAGSGAYLRDSSRVPRRCPFNYFKPSYAIRSVPSLSDHAIAYRWRPLPRVRRHRASKLQGSSERVLP